MKNKTMTLLLFLICSFHAGYSQNVFPTFADSAKWNVFQCSYGLGVTCNTNTFCYKYDTIFCGKIYSKAIQTDYPDHSFGYYRTDSLSTYLRNSTNCLDKEYLIYDFSMNVGDTVFTGYQIGIILPDTTQFVLNSIDTIIIDGVRRKIFHLFFNEAPGTGPPFAFIPMVWIEGIGSTTHPFYSMACLPDFCEMSFNLLCYDSSGTELYADTTFNTCDTSYSTAINEFTEKNEIGILPNPFSNSIAITAENETIFQIDIYSILGESVYSYKGINKQNFKIEFGNYLQKGIYLMKVQTDKGLLTKKIVKTE
jgi:hypothetical protein